MRWSLVVLSLVMLVAISKVSAVHVTITDQSIQVEGVTILSGKTIAIQKDGIVVDSIKYSFTIYDLVNDPITALGSLISSLDTENATTLCERLPSYIDAQIFEVSDPQFIAKIADNLESDKLFEILNDQNLSIQKGNEITFYMTNKSNIKLGGRIDILYDDFTDDNLTNRDPTVPTSATKIYKYFRPVWEFNGNVSIDNGTLVFGITGGSIKLPYTLQYKCTLVINVSFVNCSQTGEFKVYFPFVKDGGEGDQYWILYNFNTTGTNCNWHSMCYQEMYGTLYDWCDECYPYLYCDPINKGVIEGRNVSLENGAWHTLKFKWKQYSVWDKIDVGFVPAYDDFLYYGFSFLPISKVPKWLNGTVKIEMTPRDYPIKISEIKIEYHPELVVLW